MSFGLLKRSMPRSLFGRAALILLLPVLTLQGAVSLGFFQRHFEDVTRQMTRSVLLELRFLQDTVNAAPDLEAALVAAAVIAVPMELAVTLPVEAVPGADSRHLYDLSGRAMIATLRDGLPGLLAVDLIEDRRVTLWVETGQGDMQVAFHRRRVAASNPHQLLVVIVVLGVVLTVVAYLFMRNQLRPIAQLAEAATEYGKGRIVPYRPWGATEVRVAGTAFLEMRGRIERQNQARTLMLSGISHDLRTPLTRMRLGLALIGGDEAEALRHDVDEMRRMIDGFLDFARGDAGDALETVDVTELVRHAVADAARAGQAVTMAPVDPGGAERGVSGVEWAGPVPLRPLAIRRALDNLIGNALRHGSRAEVSVVVGQKTVRITVEDDGPGIPAEQRTEAMRPFTRLDPARNQDRGPGVGLGLAIVSDIARGHGGQLRLSDSARLGGLRADLILAR
ncbi:MAG: two-component sensor histidine kinase [Rubellimicrobium sp.]|nr:two-component sensor histidine kinase [Rubellimicrobium sp.]